MKSELSKAINNKSWFSTYVAFVLKAVFAASTIMFACMAFGELVYEKNLFNGFLGRPTLWLGVFLETTFATIFMTTFGCLFLFRARFLSRRIFAIVSTIVWCLMSLILVALYGHFYWTREWHITAIAPGLFFGWILPGLISIAYLVYLSFELRDPN